jgi:hypothetical protein
MTVKDVMVRWDGTSGDDARLAAANQIAGIFDGHITGLFFNVLSSRIPDGLDGVDAKRLRAAKEAGDASARALAEALPYLHQASKVGVLVVEGEHQTGTDVLKADDAVLHLRHHGISAVKYRAVGGGRRDRQRLDRRMSRARCKLAGDGQLRPLAPA